jgi:hypothetical protein
MTWYVLWHTRRETEEPYRENRIRFRASTVLGVWARRLSIFAVLLTGIWYLHRHPELLKERPTQIKLLVILALLLTDQYFRNAVLPSEPAVEPKYSRASTCLLICIFGFVITSLV